EILCQELFHFHGNVCAIFPGQIQPATSPGAGRWIGIGAAAVRDERDGIGVIAFEGFLRETSPIAADFVELAAESSAMAGIICDERADLSGGISGEQNRKRMIDRAGRVITELNRAALRYAAVAGKFNAALRPGKLARSAVLQCSEGDFFKLLDQPSSVAVDG